MKLFAGCCQVCVCWSLRKQHTEALGPPIDALKSLREVATVRDGQRGKVVRCMKAITRLGLISWADIASCPIERFKCQRNFGEASHRVLQDAARQNGIEIATWSS